MSPWWGRYPGRWERELAAFDERGWSYRLLFNPPGGRSLIVSYPREDSAMDATLVVRFGASYPFFPPTVFDRHNSLGLSRHRDPVGGRLCLDHDDAWNLNDTAAAFLDRQLSVLLAAQDEPGLAELDGLEPRAGEPVTGYARIHGRPTMLIDSQWEVPAEVGAGVLVAHLSNPPGGDEPGSGCVASIYGPRMRTQILPAAMLVHFPVVVFGRWMRWTGYDPGMSAEAVYSAVKGRLPRVEFNHWERMPSPAEPDVQSSVSMCDPSRAEVIGLLIPSETNYRTVGEEWLFLICHRHDDQSPWTVELTAAQHAGRADMAARLPDEGVELTTKRVMLAGVGAIGGTIAQELARTGLGRLDIVDPDIADPATACRQHAPIHLAGLPKAIVCALGIGTLNPYCDVQPHVFTVGGSDEPSADRFVQLAARADVVVDATANPMVARYLGALARAAGTSFIHASATAGAWGGTVVTIPPGESCWGCLEHHRADHTIPAPPVDPDGHRHPPGCSAAVFTGTSADLGHVALHATRVALELLARPIDSGAAVAVLRLRDRHGRVIPASWEPFPLTRHSACGNHATDHQSGPRQNFRQRLT